MIRRSFLLLAFLAACGRPETPPETPQVEQPPITTTARPNSEAMLKHWVYVTALRDAVIVGNLDDARAAATKAAAEKPPTVPVGWMPYVESMRNYTKAASEAESLAAVASATANLGATCGGCHAATSASVEMLSGQPPAEGGDVHSHMKRHVWAANAMWEGLIGPSDGRWSDGAGALAEKPSEWTDVPNEKSSPVKPMEERIHDLGVRASSASEPSDRAAIYSEFLATCAECHSGTFGGPE